MEKLVDLWDKSIKELKASTEFSLEDKTAKFQEMLNIYFKFLECWFNLTDLDQDRQSGDLNFCNRILGEKITSDYQEQLNNSRNFNVQLTALGRQKRDFLRYAPKTLEDIFTFIHQSLINIISLKYKDVFPGVGALNLPELCKYIIDKILTLNDLSTGIRYVSFLSYNFVNNNILFTYNIPLRTHSIILQIKYDFIQKTAYLKIIFYGDNEENRWERMSDYVEIASYLTDLTVSESIAEHMIVQFEWRLIEKDYQKDIEKILKIIVTCADISFDTDHSEEYRGKSGARFLLTLYDLLGGDNNSFKINKAIIDLSLKNERIHWFLPFLELDKIKDRKAELKDLAEKLYTRLSDMQSDYFLFSVVFIYKILNDPRLYMGGVPDYYLINKENYNQRVSYIEKTMVLSYLINKVLFILFKLNSNLKRFEQGKTEVIEIVKEGLNSGDYSIRQAAFSVLIALVKQGLEFKEAEEIVTKEINSPDFYVQNNALNLLIALVEKGQVFKKAISTATWGIKSLKDDIQTKALNLWKALFEQGEGFKEAINLVKERIKGSFFNALKLLIALVEKGQSFAEAIEIAKEEITSKDYIVQSYALDLWKTLFKKGQGFKEAITVAKEGIENKNEFIQVMALTLLTELVRNGQGFEDAMNAAEKLSNSYDKVVKEDALALWMVLFKNAKKMDDEIRIKFFEKATQRINRYESSRAFLDFTSSLFDLLKELVAKEQNLKEAINTATTGIKSLNASVNNSALDLWGELFKKGYGFKEGVSTAKELVGMRRFGIWNLVLKLWTALFENIEKMDEEERETVFKEANLFKEKNARLKELLEKYKPQIQEKGPEETTTKPAISVQ